MPTLPKRRYANAYRQRRALTLIAAAVRSGGEGVVAFPLREVFARDGHAARCIELELAGRRPRACLLRLAEARSPTAGGDHAA